MMDTGSKDTQFKVWHGAYSEYLEANAAYYNLDEERPNEEALKLYDAKESALDRLMLLPLSGADAHDRLRRKLEFLGEEILAEHMDGAKNYPRHLAWLGVIKADVAALTTHNSSAA